MSLIKLRTNDSSANPFDTLLNDFFEGEFLPGRRNRSFGSMPAANIKETEKSYQVELASPGMNKEDFKIEVDEDLLTIRSEKESEKEENSTRYTKREFNYTSFVRSFRLPEEVDSENISAKYDGGILLLEIPKRAVEEKKVRKIDIK
ncbi:Hsp20/alpha crystallin family protein [Cryomorpha ignava]|uniref:Hsp20/alpha crystallin family protein n=1 Tax=Cryomorpha ignava TaxID=101383 RepID=A0A7K3WP64_9FLAO|nr:Hsp20/alpha crystallin family protein [Cryomorpha ignava]NEN22515.1 Hsp20/alpha crystallin family protein [Cryomorpha ignava]